MNEENMNNEVELDEEQAQAELESLKSRADLLGIKYHPKSGADKLRAKINMHMENLEEANAEAEEKAEAVKPTKNTKRTKSGKPASQRMTPAQFKKHEFEVRKKEAAKLVRIRVTCMNPNKKGWEGEIISCGSAKLGTFKKYVPFNAENGWHVPNIIFQEMKERKYTTFVTVKGPRGESMRRGKLVSEFNIEVLPPLTQNERTELMRQQALAAGNSVDF